jgi:hypothetical protein
MKLLIKRNNNYYLTLKEAKIYLNNEDPSKIENIRFIRDLYRNYLYLKADLDKYLRKVASQNKKATKKFKKIKKELGPETQKKIELEKVDKKLFYSTQEAIRLLKVGKSYFDWHHSKTRPFIPDKYYCKGIVYYTKEDVYKLAKLREDRLNKLTVSQDDLNKVEEIRKQKNIKN